MLSFELATLSAVAVYYGISDTEHTIILSSVDKFWLEYAQTHTVCTLDPQTHQTPP